MKFVMIICVIILIACDSKTDLVDPETRPNNNIPIGTLSEVNMDTVLIDSMVRFLDNDSIPTVHSVLIIKDGKLVTEQYYKGYNKDARHDLRSAGKSISSILLGIAIQKGLVKNENERVLDLIPIKNIRNNSSMKKRMLLKHVLTMTDGFRCTRCVEGFQGNPEPIEYLMGLPVDHEPGTRWFYNDATPSLIEYVVMAQAQMSMVEFMRSELYKPLDIHVANDFNINYLRPRDMAQLGLLYLNGGVYDGKQIVSEEWIEKSTTRQTELAPYGYFWWVYELTDKKERTHSLYAARGNGGNDIIVFPDENMVVVFTGNDFDSAVSNNARLLKEFILAAIND